MPARVREELEAAAARCREALKTPEFQGLDALKPGVPGNAGDWFDLLNKHDKDPLPVAVLMGMKKPLPAELAKTGVVERYAVLNALSVSSLRIVSMPLPDTIKRYYATLCAEIAAGEHQWKSQFDVEGDPERFLDIAELATLRRFPAGALNFAFERLAPLRVMLSVHPLSLPSYLYKRAISMPFTKPSIGPHVNYGRKGSLILQRIDFERSLWLMAKTTEMNPKANGINGSSWFHSKTAGDVFPHLGWIREIYADGGAYLVDTFPAEPDGYGFAHNSRKRQVLFDRGEFCPRQTAFFWSRDDFLDWASRHPELIPEGETPVRAPKRRSLIRVRSPKPARPAKHNSSITLWNGRAALDRLGQWNYAALVLALPALILSGAAFFISGPWLTLLTFPIGLFLSFTFQYFFSQ
jgi:hypothetical protein